MLDRKKPTSRKEIRYAEGPTRSHARLQADRQADKQADGQAGRQTDRPTDQPTDRQIVNYRKECKSM